MPVIPRLVIVLLSLPVVAMAQPATPAPASLPGLGPIGLPLPPIGLPLPPIGLQAAPEPGREAAPAPPAPGSPRRRAEWPVVFVVPPHPFAIVPFHQGPAPQAVGPGALSPLPQPPAGRLRLEVEPAVGTQLFVDAVYVGELGDLRNEIDLPPGVRRIEFRAPGYETLMVDVQIVSRDAITYRGTLYRTAPDAFTPEVADAPPDPPIVPMGSRTIYEIPGCYLGNVPPQEVTLPAGCDPARLRVHTP